MNFRAALYLFMLAMSGVARATAKGGAAAKSGTKAKKSKAKDLAWLPPPYANGFGGMGAGTLPAFGGQNPYVPGYPGFHAPAATNLGLGMGYVGTRSLIYAFVLRFHIDSYVLALCCVQTVVQERSILMERMVQRTILLVKGLILRIGLRLMDPPRQYLLL